MPSLVFAALETAAAAGRPYHAEADSNAGLTRVPVTSGLSSQHRGPAHDHGNLTAH
jgi:hypothetical protein